MVTLHCHMTLTYFNFSILSVKNCYIYIPIRTSTLNIEVMEILRHRKVAFFGSRLYEFVTQNYAIQLYNTCTHFGKYLYHENNPRNFVDVE